MNKIITQNQKNIKRYLPHEIKTRENEEEYNNYINKCKKASLYDTKKSAQYGEQLLTLSTCEYSQEDGRFVIVARKTKKLD